MGRVELLRKRSHMRGLQLRPVDESGAPSRGIAPTDHQLIRQVHELTRVGWLWGCMSNVEGLRYKMRIGWSWVVGQSHLQIALGQFVRIHGTWDDAVRGHYRCIIVRNLSNNTLVSTIEPARDRLLSLDEGDHIICGVNIDEAPEIGP